LIDDAGLRGFRVGNAQVSTKHCGFVINLGGATAKEIVDLMNHVIDQVEADSGVRLNPEVKRIGEF
jgi:UDP-N-acetylmuramate dehydrogenase